MSYMEDSLGTEKGKLKESKTFYDEVGIKYVKRFHNVSGVMWEDIKLPNNNFGPGNYVLATDYDELLRMTTQLIVPDHVKESIEHIKEQLRRENEVLSCTDEEGYPTVRYTALQDLLEHIENQYKRIVKLEVKILHREIEDQMRNAKFQAYRNIREATGCALSEAREAFRDYGGEGPAIRALKNK